jgi:hypothetical protein
MGKHAEVLIDRLISQMHSYQPDCSWEWVYAIGEIGLVNENVMPNLVRRLEKTFYGQWIMGRPEEYPVYVRQLLGVLEKSGPKSAPATELLANILLEKADEPAQVGVLKVLGAIGPAAEKAIPAIEKKGLASRNAEVQKAAQEAMKRIRPNQAEEKK